MLRWRGWRPVPRSTHTGEGPRRAPSSSAGEDCEDSEKTPSVSQGAPIAHRPRPASSALDLRPQGVKCSPSRRHSRTPPPRPRVVLVSGALCAAEVLAPFPEGALPQTADPTLGPCGPQPGTRRLAPARPSRRPGASGAQGSPRRPLVLRAVGDGARLPPPSLPRCWPRGRDVSAGGAGRGRDPPSRPGRPRVRWALSFPRRDQEPTRKCGLVLWG